MTTLYWHDYETFGTDPRYDRPSQFAGVRTDTELNILGEPLMIYCRQATDYLPHPEACLVTGITPQQANESGVTEAEFIKQIHAELSEPGTCGVGYNSIRFDDEFTRFTLYRNFYDPYAREWQNDNSRWDIIDMVRLTRALRPEGIQWPNHNDGRPDFRLESLTAANQIEHQGAHDALADVYATIALAKLIKQKQPKLYDYVFARRRKQMIAPLLNIHTRTPVLHVSRMYPSEYCSTALVVPLARDPVNQNGIIVYDLRHHPAPLLNEDPDTLRRWLFAPASKLPEGITRPALKTLHLNKCPVVVPVSTLSQEAAARLQIDRKVHDTHLELLNQAGDLTDKLTAIYSQQDTPHDDDPDAALYSGGFFSDHDRRKMALVRQADPAQLHTLTIPFDDPRLPEMLFRYRARNWPDSLSPEEQQQWKQFRQQRLCEGNNSAILTIAQYFEAIERCQAQVQSEQQRQILQALISYGQHIQADLPACT